jgi:hypothetical protein
MGEQIGQNNFQRNGLDAMKRIWREASPRDKCSLQRNLSERDARLLLDLAAIDATPPVAIREWEGEAPAEPEPRNDEPQKRAGTSHPAQLELRPPNHEGLPTIEFETLVELDNASLGRVLRQAQGRLLLLALAGASSTFIQRVYRQLPRREAQLLQRQIEQQGPIALRDVAEAQRRLAALAGKLAAAGEIEIPRTRRLAMAA